MDYAARFLCVCICITCTRPICFCIFSITWNAVRYHTPCAMHVRVSVCVCVPIVCCIHVGHRRSRTGTNTSHTHSSFHIHKVQVANARAHALRPLYLAPNCVCARAYNSGHHWRGGSQKLIRIYHKHNNNDRAAVSLSRNSVRFNHYRKAVFKPVRIVLSVRRVLLIFIDLI